VDEIMDFVREQKLGYAVTADRTPNDRWGANADMGKRELLLYTCGRRLARERNFKDAAPMLPEAFRPLLARYALLYRRGHSSVATHEVRALCLMEAARIHRWAGMELFGAQGEPDGAVWGGNFDAEQLATARVMLG
jgi:hypothetical protein